ncbi:MAG: cysteine desulfurase family protein [Gemmatimonadales bacterium]
MAPRSVYLDNAATTPVRDEVRQAMLPYLTSEAFGNPSSPHKQGRSVRAATEAARRRVARSVGADPKHVFFTAGGTEADNLAVIGAALASKAAGGPFRVAVSAIEHKAILGAAHAVEDLGGEAVILPVDAEGALDLAALDAALAKGVAVVSVMWVNNETGVVQDVAAIHARCTAAGTLFHADAVQAFGKIPVDLRTLPGALCTISAHKIHGPKGSGALIAPDPARLHPLVHGGGQQGGLRPGTENVPGIVGLGIAAELAAAEQPDTARHTQALRDAFEVAVRAIPDSGVNPPRGTRAPHISNVGFDGADAEALLMHLDLAGIACSAGSACSTGTTTISHVLEALGTPIERATGSLRFSFDHTTTQADLDYVLERLPRIVAKVRSLATLLR